MGGGGGANQWITMSCGIRIVRGTATYGQFAGHRGWVREGDVPSPAKGGSFWHFYSLVLKLVFSTSFKMFSSIHF